MNVIQNYLTTFMKGDFNVFEMRIFMKIVEHANQLITGQRISRLLGKATCVNGFDCHFSVPFREILNDDTNNHPERLKEALKRLHDKDVEFYDGERHTWHLTSIIEDVRIVDGDSNLYFTVPLWLVEYILNFVNRNFTMYNLEAAMKLSSAYAVRMYWIVCRLEHPLTYSLPMFRAMLGVDGSKYAKTKDFVRRCVAPAKKMLDEKNLNSFTYSLGCSKASKYGKYDQITIFPVKRQEATPNELTAQASLSAFCNPILRDYLLQQAHFEKSELQKNKATLMKYTSTVPQWQDKVVSIVERARHGRRGKGWIIAAMKSEISNCEKVGKM